ncbi:HAD family hydrolase [Salegentibacter chungangensis]|uniref:HAD family hydrolase n=1 Tax=Salegentibacter chungangensis TaxID=1335724 RepID=A0ABW3NXE7_9FLAO
MPKNVIFDMDGVLVDSEPLHTELEVILFEKLGINITSAYHDQLKGMSPFGMWKKIKKDFGLKTPVEEFLEQEEQLKTSEIRKRDINTNPGVSELVRNLYESDFRLSVGSSSPREIISLFMEKSGLTAYFDHFVSSEDVEHGKPEPDIFLKISDLYKISSSQFVVIEDSHNGVLAAKAAGMSCVGYRNLNSGEQDLSSADLVIDDFEELTPEILRKLNQK